MRYKVNTNDIVPVLIDKGFDFTLAKEPRLMIKHNDNVVGLALLGNEEGSDLSFLALILVWNPYRQDWCFLTTNSFPFSLNITFSPRSPKRFGTCN